MPGTILSPLPTSTHFYANHPAAGLITSPLLHMTFNGQLQGQTVINEAAQQQQQQQQQNDEPLDLSIKPASPPTPNQQALDLTKHSPTQPDNQPLNKSQNNHPHNQSWEATYPGDASSSKTALVRYMEQAGLLPAVPTPPPTHERMGSSSPPEVNKSPSPLATSGDVNTTPAHRNSYSHHIERFILDIPRTSTPMGRVLGSPHLMSAIPTSPGGMTSNSSGVTSPKSAHDASFTSVMSLGENMESARRPRKKTWRQVNVEIFFSDS